MFALVSVAGACLSFLGKSGSGVADPLITNGVSYRDTKRVNGTKNNGSESVTFTELTAGAVYYVEFAGQDGTQSNYAGGKVPGKGAVCFAFYKADKNYSDSWMIGYNNGRRDGMAAYSGYTEGKGWGGGSTHVTSNIALPINGTSGTSIAGGGGGNGPNDDHDRDHTFGGNGGSAGWGQGENGEDREGQKGGGGATQTAKGNPDYYGIKQGSHDGWGAGGGGGYFEGGAGEYDDSKNCKKSGKDWDRETGGGGGGSSSPNCYPLYAYDYGLKDKSHESVNTGNGYILIGQISPASYPSGSSVVYNASAAMSPGTETSIWGDTTNYPNLSKTGISRHWVYSWSTDDGASWTKFGTTEPPARSAVGTTKVKWEYRVKVETALVNSAGEDGWQSIANGEFNLTVKKADGRCGEPTLLSTNSRTYDGKSHRMVEAIGDVLGDGTFKWAISTSGSHRYNCAADPEGQHAELLKEYNGQWITNLDSAYNDRVWEGGKEYFIYYYADAGTNNEATQVKRVGPVKIKACPPNLGKGSLYAKGGESNFTYNGNKQILFGGAGIAEGPAGGGTIFYTVTKDSPNLTAKQLSAPSAFNAGYPNSEDENLWKKDAGTYYLWYRFQANKTVNSSNMENQDWTPVVTSVGGKVVISKTIAKATLTAIDGVTIAPDRDYDGTHHAVYAGAAMPGGSIPTAELGVVGYVVSYTLGDGARNKLSGENAANTTAIDAGTYELTVSWGGGDNINSGTYTFPVHTIRKVSRATDIQLSGLDINTSATYNGPTGRQMVRGGALSVTIGGTTETLREMLLNNSYNNLSFCVTQSDLAQPAASLFAGSSNLLRGDGDLREKMANVVGVNYIWIRFNHHKNVRDGVTVCYRKGFEITKVPNVEVEISGIKANNSRPYNAAASQAYAGVLTTESYVTLKNPKYKLGTALTPGTTDSDAWVTDFRTLAATDAGSYYLWVIWEESETVAACKNGKLVSAQPYTITQKTNFQDISFGGVTKNDDKNFDNQDTPYGRFTMGSSLTFSIKNGGQNMTAAGVERLGQISYAVGSDWSAPATSGYVGDPELTRAKNVGSYYLSIAWTGSANVLGGKKLYILDPSASPIPFVISKTQDGSMKFTGVEAKPDVARYYTGSGVALFQGTPSLVIMNGDYEYVYTPNAEYLYAVTTSGTNAPVATSDDWKTDLKLATQTHVRWSGSKPGEGNPDQDYYLWIKVPGDDNIEGTTLAVAQAALLRTEAVAKIPPTARDLTYDEGKLQTLINSSKQTEPMVEYSLDEISWTKDIDDIQGALAATYTVYYRGAEGNDYFVQNSYKSITVVIRKDVGDVKTIPTGKSPTFNGSAQTIFDVGIAKQSETVLEYRFADDPNTNHWETDPDKMQKTNAGVYILYYRVKASDNVSQGEQGETTVQILKAPIEFSNVWVNGNLRYNAQEQSAILTDFDFRLTNNLKIGNRDMDGITRIAGEVGIFEYGVSQSKDVYPATASQNYLDAKIKNAGTYYVWCRVWAGDNHLGTGNFNYKLNYTDQGVAEGLTPQWEQISSLSVAKAAASDNIEFSGFTWSTMRDGEKIYYNGDDQALVQFVNSERGLVQTVGGVETPNESKIWYALTRYETSPTSNSPEWKDSLNKAVQREVNPNGYYFHVKTEESNNVVAIIKCVTPVEDLVYMSPAEGHQLEFGGINATSEQDKMYDGSEQALATGDLVVWVKSNNTIVQPGAPYFLFTTDTTKPDSNDSHWRQGLSNAKVKPAGEYYLWVKIPTTTNIKEEIRCINITDPVHILKADETNIEVITAMLKVDPEYNAAEQGLIYEDPETTELKRADIVLKNGNDIGARGSQELYYVAASLDEEIPVYTAGAAGWTSWDGVNGKNAGTYYVWVVFPEGPNYVQLAPVYCGSVTIQKSSGKNITYSNISYKAATSYNGAPQVLASLVGNDLVQKIGNQVVTTGKVLYGVSTSDVAAPDTWKESLADVTATNAGTYFIWVKVAESDNVAAYMKSTQNQASAVRIDQATSTMVSIHGVNPIAGLKYNGTAQKLWTGELELKIGNNSIRNDVYSRGKVTWCVTQTQQLPYNAVWFDSLDEVRGDVAKQYYLWISVTECANIKALDAVSVGYVSVAEIGKGQAQIIEGSVEFYDNLIYCGQKQELVKTPGNSNFENYGGRVVFYIVNGSTGTVLPTNPAEWYDDYRAITRQPAGDYLVYYAVLPTDNWEGVTQSRKVTINKADPIFATNPTAIDGLIYNDKKQPLIQLGTLLENSRTEGCYIEYSLDPDMLINVVNNRDNTDEEILATLMALNAGTHKVYYRGAVDSKNSNYKTSAIKSVEVTITKRVIYWVNTPQAVAGLKYDGKRHDLVTTGELSAKGTPDDPIAVRFSIDKFNMNDTGISPQTTGIGMYFVWYRVDYNPDNNTFGGESPDDGLIVVLVTTVGVSWREEPRGVTTMYNATAQDLVAGAELSDIGVDEDIMPFVRYQVYKDGELFKDWTKQGDPKPQATEIGVYTINYKVIHEDEFVFYGEKTGSFTSEIYKGSLEENALRAIKDEGGSLDFELTGNYSVEFKQKLSDYVRYDYCVVDDYATGDTERQWFPLQGNYGPTGRGHYEIRARLIDNIYTNAYTQQDEFATYDVSFPITLNINFDGDIVPSVRVWLDFTGSTSFEDAAFKKEQNISKTQATKFEFENVNSMGKDGNGVIKIQYVSNGTANGRERYYYLSLDPIFDSNRDSVVLNSINTSSAMLAYANRGLKERTSELWVYEVYRITYNANGASSTFNLPNEGWKWHDVDYKLANNVLYNNGRTPIGWNKTAGGSGMAFADDALYRENVSQIFYAQFASVAEVTHTVRWKIANYEIDNYGNWFNTDNPVNDNKTPGVVVKHGSKIYLPSIVNIDEKTGEVTFSTDKMLYSYIKKWVLEDDGMTEYSPEFTATGDFTFRAELVDIEKDSKGNDVNYVEYQFFLEGETNSLVSNRVAWGASSYMALSGLTQKDYEKYPYEEWLANYPKILEPNIDASGTMTSQRVSYTFPAIAGVETQNEKDSKQEMMLMVIIIGAGAVAAIGSIAIYLPIRKKRGQSKL